MEMKHYNLIAFLISALTVLSGCKPGPPAPAPPCATAYDCIGKPMKSNSRCCTDSYGSSGGNYYVINNHPDKTIIAVYQLWEYNKDFGTRPVSESPIIRQIPSNKGTANLPVCSDDRVLGRCGYKYFYQLLTACFKDDPNDCPTWEIPLDLDIPRKTCLDEYSRGSSYCYVLNYSQLESSQQKALVNFRDGILRNARNHDFGNSLIQMLSPNPLDSSCSSRITISRNYKFSSIGHPCGTYVEFVKPITIDGTSLTYDQLWIDWPNHIQGEIHSSTGFMLQMDTTYGNSVSLRTISHPDKVVRYDYITKIYLTGSVSGSGDLVFQGSNFICFSIKNIPSGS